MKRTGEFVLSIIAGIVNILALLSGVRAVSADPSALKQQLSAANVRSQDINNIIHTVSSIGNLLIILSIISIILAVIALILLKRNSDKPKWAGWLLILSGVVSLMEIIPGILYIIAGIMALVRKPMFE